MRWIEDQQENEVVESLSKKLNYIYPIVKIYCFDMESKHQRKHNPSLDPKLAHFTDPFEIKGMTQAVERICQALSQKENILLVGDYDVDGITSTVIIKKNLTEARFYSISCYPKEKDRRLWLKRKSTRAWTKNGRNKPCYCSRLWYQFQNEAKIPRRKRNRFNCC